MSVSRLGLFKKYAQDIICWRNERFDGLVARMVGRERPSALICYDGCALKAFKKAKSLGVLCILDQSIAHIRAGLKLLAEEADLHPNFADSLPIAVPDWVIEQCSEEATIADQVLAGSEYVKESLTEHGVDPSRVTIIPYGADIERFYPRRQRDEGVFRLLFVGQISQRKGVKYLLEAVKQLNLPVRNSCSSAVLLVLAGALLHIVTILLKFPMYRITKCILIFKEGMCLCIPPSVKDRQLPSTKPLRRGCP